MQEWDLALKTAVVTAQLVESRNTGGAAGDCITQYPKRDGQQEDNDEAVLISRDLDVCRRAAAQASTDPTLATDSSARGAARVGLDLGELANVSAAQAEAQALNTERGGKDVSAAAMGQVVPMAPIIVLCHNPVIEGDHSSCGALGLSPRLGDIRFPRSSTLSTSRRRRSAWGIMVDADDPLTGEKVAGQHQQHLVGNVTDICLSQSLVDLLSAPRQRRADLRPTSPTGNLHHHLLGQNAAKLGQPTAAGPR